jgi:hypothetical protein
MTRIITVFLALALSVAGAHAFGMGRFSAGFSKLGSLGQRGAVIPPPGIGSALLADNTNPALLSDNINPACLAGGC